MTNNISQLQKELHGLLENKFFFREPEDRKVIIYSSTFIFLVIMGILFNVEIIAAFFAVFPLTYLLGARGFKFYGPLVVVASVVLIHQTSLPTASWFIFNMLLAPIIYIFITKRYSKMTLVLTISSLLFMLLSLMTALLIRFKKIDISSTKINGYVNDYLNRMLEVQPDLDKNVYLLYIETLEKSFPSILFLVLFVYSLVLINYTLSMLAREYVITPVFPNLANISIRPRVAVVFLVVSFFSYLVSLIYSDDNFAYLPIVLDNFMAIFSWVFVANGLFTLFYFAKDKQGSGFLKIIATVVMILMPSIYELIGFADSILRIREYSEIRKRR